MPYQYTREPLTREEASRLANACEHHEEKLVTWTLLETGLRVSELAGLRKTNLDCQAHRIMVYGKGGPYGSRTKRRVVPLSPRIQPLIEGHFALHESIGMSPRTIQRLLKRLANGACISRPVSPHVLRHYVDFRTITSSDFAFDRSSAFSDDCAQYRYASTRHSPEVSLSSIWHRTTDRERWWSDECQMHSVFDHGLLPGLCGSRRLVRP